MLDSRLSLETQPIPRFNDSETVPPPVNTEKVKKDKRGVLQSLLEILSVSLYYHVADYPVSSTILKHNDKYRFDPSQVFTSSIVFFPLSFMSKEEEKHFYDYITQTFYMRCKTAALATSVIFFVHWISTIFCLSNSHISDSSVLLHVTYSVSMLFVILSLRIPCILSQFQCFSDYFECIFNFFIVTNVCVLAFWILSYSALQSNVPPEKATIYFNICIYIIPLWFFIVMDAIVQTRTRTNFFIHITICLIFVLVIFLQVLIFTKKNSSDVTVLNPQTHYWLLNIVILAFITILLYMMRWLVEVQERIQFFQRVRATHEVKQLKDSCAKRKRRKGATIVEDVTALVEKVVCNINEVFVETNLPSLVEVLDLLRQCQEILTDTTNLYSVRYKNKSEILETEEQALDKHFISNYLDKSHIDRLWKPHSKVRHFSGLARSTVDLRKTTEHCSFVDALGCGQDRGLFALYDSPHQCQHIPTLAPSLSAKSYDVFYIGRNWDVNILKLAKEYPNIMLEVGAALLLNKLEAVNAKPVCLFNYLHKLQSCYPPNPYHNKIHAASVAHATACLMHMLYIQDSAHHSSINDIAVIIAALGHDAGHPGRNNNFFVNTSDNLALIYNDGSILENAHSAITFKCLETPGANIFARVTPEDLRRIRKRIVEMILTTDMGQHFEAVSRFRLRQQAIGFNHLRDAEDMWLVLRMCLKCADLAHTMVDWEQHLDWSLRVVEEFYQQGDHELAMGLKVSQLCDRSCHADFSKGQKGFIEFVVQPLLTQMEELKHGSTIRHECVRRLLLNKSKWEQLVSEKYISEVPEEYRNMKTDPFLSMQIMVSLYIQGHMLVRLDNRESPLQVCDQ